MTVVLSISLLLLTLIVIGFISINIMRRTYYDLERRRKMKERNKKEKLASIVQKREDKEDRKEYPKSKYPSPSLLNNTTYGILNDGYETEKIKDMTVDMKITASIFDVQPEEYDHLDYNRSINELSETYCNGTHV